MQTDICSHFGQIFCMFCGFVSAEAAGQGEICQTADARTSCFPSADPLTTWIKAKVFPSNFLLIFICFICQELFLELNLLHLHKLSKSGAAPHQEADFSSFITFEQVVMCLGFYSNVSWRVKEKTAIMEYLCNK